MIKLEMYMSRIRPFINTELINVMTGLRRSGKSVMLELIKGELTKQGFTKEQFISFNFEKMENERFCNAVELHNEVMSLAGNTNGKVFLFFLTKYKR